MLQGRWEGAKTLLSVEYVYQEKFPSPSRPPHRLGRWFKLQASANPKKLTKDQGVCTIRKHAKCPREDDKVGIPTRRVDRINTEFTVEPFERSRERSGHDRWLLFLSSRIYLSFLKRKDTATSS